MTVSETPLPVAGSRFILGIALGALFCVARPYNAAPMDPDLVAFYTFDEGPSEALKEVRDHSGHDNHGINTGAKYVDIGNDRGYVLRFDTAKANVDCGADTSLDLTGKITMELWLYPETRPRKGEPGKKVFAHQAGNTARLIGSDWAPSTSAGQADPGGPIDQQLAFNFMEIQPYLEN